MTAEPALTVAVAPLSALRRLPVPAWDPPYDDELDREPARAAPRGRAGDALQGALALSFVLASGVPAVPELPEFPPEDQHSRAGGPPALRLVAVPAEDAADEVEFGPQPTPRAALPEPRTWAGRFVQAVVEVLGGDRPATQLVRWTSAEVYDEVAIRAAARARHRRNASGGRAVVRSLHVAEPADGVAEVCALVRHGIRCTAVAFRLEGMDGRWQCTALELG